MKRALIILGTLASLLGVAVAAKRVMERSRVPNITDSTGATTLPNGWRITPAGTHIELPGDLPMKMVAADADHLLVLTGGYHDHSLNVIDVRAQKRTASLDVVKTWDGMAFDQATGTVYMSGGGPGKRSFPETIRRLGITSP
jgi:hypothetical protein